MGRGQAKVTDSEIGTKLIELSIIELFAIVYHNDVGDAKAAYNVSPNEGYDSYFGDRGQRLGLDPLSIIVYHNYDIFYLSFS